MRSLAPPAKSLAGLGVLKSPSVSWGGGHGNSQWARARCTAKKSARYTRPRPRASGQEGFWTEPLGHFGKSRSSQHRGSRKAAEAEDPKCGEQKLSYIEREEVAAEAGRLGQEGRCSQQYWTWSAGPWPTRLCRKPPSFWPLGPEQEGAAVLGSPGRGMFSLGSCSQPSVSLLHSCSKQSVQQGSDSGTFLQ